MHFNEFWMANLSKYEHIKHENYDVCHINEKKKKSKLCFVESTIDFNKHDIDIFINDTGDIGRLFKITRRLELRFWPTRKWSQTSQGDFIALVVL